jgi:hypothetical protein
VQAPDLGWRRSPTLHGMQVLTARIGLAVPGRPIGPWSRRTGAPKASATRRDRSPPVHGEYTRSRQVEDCNGHQQSPRELRNRRSHRQHSRLQAPLQEAVQSSSLPPTQLPQLPRDPPKWSSPIDFALFSSDGSRRTPIGAALVLAERTLFEP